MVKFIGSCVAVASLSLALFAVARFARADDQLNQRFLREAPKAWDAYRERKVHLYGTVVERRIDMHSGETIASETCNIKIAGTWGVAIQTKTRKDSDEVSNDQSQQEVQTAWGQNSKYSFMLEKVASTNEWVIKELRPNQTPNDRSDVWDAFGYYLWGGQRIYTPFWKIAKQPTFSVTEVSLSQRQGEELVEVQFRYKPPKGADHVLQQNPIRDGTVLLDPKRYWLIREAHGPVAEWLSNEVGQITVESNEYDDSISNYPILKKSVTRVRGNPKDSKSAPGTYQVDHEIRIESNLSLLENPDEREFMLSAFGLPEPFQEPQSRFWLWLLIAGLVLIGIAFRLRWRMSRSASATS